MLSSSSSGGVGDGDGDGEGCESASASASRDVGGSTAVASGEDLSSKLRPTRGRTIRGACGAAAAAAAVAVEAALARLLIFVEHGWRRGRADGGTTAAAAARGASCRCIPFRGAAEALASSSLSQVCDRSAPPK